MKSMASGAAKKKSPWFRQEARGLANSEASVSVCLPERNVLILFVCREEYFIARGNEGHDINLALSARDRGCESLCDLLAILGDNIVTVDCHQIAPQMFAHQALIFGAKALHDLPVGVSMNPNAFTRA